MKIKTLTLDNFRAFPGSKEQPFHLDGKNLLVYGENGSGKSSVYHALKTFFTLTPSASVGETRNVFSGTLDHWIEVEFDDGHKAKWNGPPGPGEWTQDTHVVPAALRRGCLDYRALLDTNYGHGDKQINLFEMAVSTLLGDYSVPTRGGRTALIAELWEKVEELRKLYRFPSNVTKITEACADFNLGFRSALEKIKTEVEVLLEALPVEGMRLDALDFPGITYNYERKSIDGTELIPATSLHDYAIDRPQHFLNEARLSALGLAIYLAGRLTSVPTDDDELKLLVLDDVLIGMDLSNRLPLLDLLRERFGDWQIVLLTHDKTWYDMTKFHVESDGTWNYVKMFEGATDGSYSVPIVVQEESASAVALAKAAEFLAQFEYQAAANYARSAFEGALKHFCEKRAVPVIFKSDLKDLNSGMLLDAIDLWVQDEDKRIFYTAALERTKLFRRIILNPLSHADAPAVKYEVEGAIEAVKKLDDVLMRKPPQHPKLLEEAATFATKPSPTPFEMQTALANLRAEFVWKLRQFCEAHSVEVPYSTKGPDVGELWDCARSKVPTLFIGGLAGLETEIEAERGWFVEEVTQTQLSALTKADLLRLIDILKRWTW